jgi:hypothetical protein
MATVTMKPVVQTPTRLGDQGETSCAAKTAQARPEAPSPEQEVWRGDWIMFKIWMAGFLILLVMNVWNMIVALFR